ncbi:allantoate amidohydrolase [Amnibacterium flavum]|uniref:Allantoate amidohydrolase n=1 Tax=Amnibacterium flavum TaxID=2173173 RepID=A0A2V1HQX8_9MICO|nr:allantoate amidohydrolase [Amnibacterium flavum]
MLDELSEVGRNPRSGGFDRFAWTDVDTECRQWFEQCAAALGLDVETDRNGNLWAWWNEAAPGSALVLGSHLDSVPSGGAFDGPLGVASAFAAIGDLQRDGFEPSRPIAVVAFADEEGARFGVACVGSRLLTGSISPASALALRDVDGVTLAEAMARVGIAPADLGADRRRIARIGEFIELHVEQGHLRTDSGSAGLGAAGSALGLATCIWPHGRWRADIAGSQNHAGTTPMADRDDPMIGLARLVLDVRQRARAAGILATVGKVKVEPGAVNAVPGLVSAWIDARGDDESRVRETIAQLGVELVEESWTSTTPFDADLTASVDGVLGGSVPRLPSGAGHDAGVIALAGIPAAMILVRNPTGISHAPAERAEPDDCDLGVAALRSILRSRAS